jgi:hypothetical protein
MPDGHTKLSKGQAFGNGKGAGKAVPGACSSCPILLRLLAVSFSDLNPTVRLSHWSLDLTIRWRGMGRSNLVQVTKVSNSQRQSKNHQKMLQNCKIGACHLPTGAALHGMVRRLWK